MKRFQGRIPLVNTFGKASLHPVDGTPIRNTIKHCFGYYTDPLSFFYKCATEKKIVITTTDNASSLLIENPAISGRRSGDNKPFSDGSGGAISYYLSKFREAHPEIKCAYLNVDIPRNPDADGWHRTRLPFIQQNSIFAQ